ncbi:MAG: cupin domain-containing protein [Chloroflexi bacterium]|nr:cupin domain-containing protein [Chloroflexota bacterium]
MLTVEDLLQLYQFEALPVEGGIFKQIYLPAERIPQAALPARYTSDKPFGTAILYLLTDDPNSFSALHRLPTDEIYHFYLGDPVEILQLYPDGSSQRVILGQDVLHGQQVQYVAPRDVWMGSHLLPGGKFALIGTTMAPGFTNDDYVGGERAALIEQYPQETALITRLTRLEQPLHMRQRDA